MAKSPRFENSCFIIGDSIVFMTFQFDAQVFLSVNTKAVESMLQLRHHLLTFVSTANGESALIIKFQFEHVIV